MQSTKPAGSRMLMLRAKRESHFRTDDRLRSRRCCCLPAGILILLLISNGPAAAGDSFPETEQRVRKHIEYLASPALRGRSGPGKVAARKYIIDQWKESGLQPFFQGSWDQTVPGQPYLTGGTGPEGRNLGGFVAGTDSELKEEWIIVNAHYDHLGILNGELYPGADDNASGVAMLLEVARQIAAAPLKRSVAFVAFDFEESMLWGSRWFIGHTPVDVEQIKLCITADMIGRSLGGLGLPTVFVMGAEHSSNVRKVLDELPVPAGLEVAQLGADMIGTRSDYGPFRDQEIPFLFFSTGEHPDYHSPRDTPDRIDYAKATRIIELITSLVQKVGNEQQSPSWEPAVYQKLKEAKAVNRVTQQLLDEEAAGEIQLSATQQFFISQVLSKTGYMVRNKKVSDDERKWVARTAQLLLISIF